MNLNRRVIINNTGVSLTGDKLKKAIYSAMRKVKADECRINSVTGTELEVDLLSKNRIVAWGYPIFLPKED